MNITLEKTIGDALDAVRAQNPLVVNVTNYVVMNNSANALLAIGASPIMAHSRLEMAEMMAIAGALVINLGTLDSVWIKRMDFAIRQANLYQKMVVLDPVGCGASRLRTETAQRFAGLAEGLIIRGNAAEIIALAGDVAESRGVDALEGSVGALDAAIRLVALYQCSVVVSGETDYVVSYDTGIEGVRIVALGNGDAMMPFVTGLGCSLSALVGAFAAVGEVSGLAASAVLGVAGEIAGEGVRGPGSLQVALLDVFYQLDREVLVERLKLSIVEAS